MLRRVFKLQEDWTNSKYPKLAISEGNYDINYGISCSAFNVDAEEVDNINLLSYIKIVFHNKIP